MKKILIVDDHEVVRAGLMEILEQAGTVFDEAADIWEALQKAREQDWDLAILDISLGDRSGLDLLQKLKQVCPTLPVLILSIHSDAKYVRRALKAGAAGYITKDTTRAELVKAVNKVMEGGHYVSLDVAEKLVAEPDEATGHPLHHALSGREFDVMRRIGSGKTVGEIADLLELSSKTVSTYRARILEKLGMRTNAEIIRYAIQNNFSELLGEPQKIEEELRGTAPETLAQMPRALLAQAVPEPRTSQPESSPQARKGGVLKICVLSGLIPYVGVAGANQVLDSMPDDGVDLGVKVESLLRVFLGKTAGVRLAHLILNNAAVGE